MPSLSTVDLDQYDDLERADGADLPVGRRHRRGRRVPRGEPGVNDRVAARDYGVTSVFSLAARLRADLAGYPTAGYAPGRRPTPSRPSRSRRATARPSPRRCCARRCTSRPPSSPSAPPPSSSGCPRRPARARSSSAGRPRRRWRSWATGRSAPVGPAPAARVLALGFVVAACGVGGAAGRVRRHRSAGARGGGRPAGAVRRDRRGAGDRHREAGARGRRGGRLDRRRGGGAPAPGCGSSAPRSPCWCWSRTGRRRRTGEWFRPAAAGGGRARSPRRRRRRAGGAVRVGGAGRRRPDARYRPPPCRCWSAFRWPNWCWCGTSAGWPRPGPRSPTAGSTRAG